MRGDVVDYWKNLHKLDFNIKKGPPDNRFTFWIGPEGGKLVECWSRVLPFREDSSQRQPARWSQQDGASKMELVSAA